MNNEIQKYDAIATIAQNIPEVINAFDRLSNHHAKLVFLTVETAMCLGAFCIIYTHYKKCKTS